MPSYRAEAIVLRTQKLGEADRIITLLTRERGKVRAVAKGVRRTKSKFGARLEPFSRVDLLVFAGKNGAVANAPNVPIATPIRAAPKKNET